MADITKKKRKRRDDAPQPKIDSTSIPKRTKVVAPSVQDAEPLEQHATISVSAFLQSTSAPPAVVTTPGFVLPPTTTFQSYAKQETLRKDGTLRPPKELLLHSETHRTMDYTAREDYSKGLLKHYIGAFDPKTGGLEVIEARKMTACSTVRARRVADQEIAKPTQPKTMRDLRNELGQAFGTKKAKKAIAALADNAILRKNDGAQLDEGELALMESIKHSASQVATRDELQAIADLARPVPKGNFDAEVIQDVYKPEEIIGADVLNAIPIRDWQEKVDNGEEVLIGSSFVAHRLIKVATGPSAVERLRLLRYLYFVLTFLKSAEGKGSRPKKVPKPDVLKERLAPAPKIVIENIRRKFSEKGELLKVHVDLLMTHLCAFACIIDNFEVDTADLRNDLALEPKVLNQYFNEIGAKTKPRKREGKQIHVAVLSLPLQFPKLRFVRQAKR